jgi:ribonuclease HII
VPTLQVESAVQNDHGPVRIAGLDEAGRGALAGPVVAAAVILPLSAPEELTHFKDVNDSKQLRAEVRERLSLVIKTHALSFGIGAVSAKKIDEIGIIQATKLAMLQALSQLKPEAQFLLIDGRIVLKSNPLPQQALIRGDSISMSIAAASILAKVFRDALMVEMDFRYPAYGFARHKGYGTEFHREAISNLGPISEHRHSFAPIRAPLL